MTSVSQNGRRARRPWTAQDQTTAEVAAACGVSYRDIGLALDRAYSLVRTRLSAHAADVSREYGRLWRQANAETMRKHTRRHYEANRDKAIERSRLWRLANPDKMREHRLRWDKRNPENRRERSRRYYSANRDKVIQKGRQWRQANQDRVRESVRRWHAANPDKVREKNRRRYACKRAARRQSLQPVTRAQIDARFALWQNRCAFCGVLAADPRNRGRKRLTVEHALALASGGLDEAANIIPACTACNSSKKSSPIEDWYRQQEWFTEARWAKIRKHCPAAVVGQLPLALAA